MSDPEFSAPPPPFDRELAGSVQDVLRRMNIPLTLERIAECRQNTEAHCLSDDAIRRQGSFDLEQLSVPGSSGEHDLPLLLCRPTHATAPHGVIYHIHGGGMVAGNYRTAELAGDLGRAEQFQLAVIGVNYRLAPENADPAPVEDCYAGLVWIAEHGAARGFDPDRIILSGNSAGGGLAAGAALLARDRDGPRILGQMLQCPMLDDRCDTPSSHQLHATGVWDGRSNRTGWTALLGDRRGTPDVSCYAAPARARDLSGLPPTFIDVGSAEALRDDAVRFANRIWQAGGQAELHVWSGAFHSFDQWVPDAVVSQAAERARISWLRRLLG